MSQGTRPLRRRRDRETPVPDRRGHRSEALSGGDARGGVRPHSPGPEAPQRRGGRGHEARRLQAEAEAQAGEAAVGAGRVEEERRAAALQGLFGADARPAEPPGSVAAAARAASALHRADEPRAAGVRRGKQRRQRRTHSGRRRRRRRAARNVADAVPPGPAPARARRLHGTQRPRESRTTPQTLRRSREARRGAPPPLRHRQLMVRLPRGRVGSARDVYLELLLAARRRHDENHVPAARRRDL
mmetsp:Transcript_8147/g.25147  ORF Transcript_8147/g.25147 Transcript_8147/m.25147 type:complete len:244 (+) Transcript_8147:261-992(+)